MTPPPVVLDPFSYCLTIEDIRQCAHHIVTRPNYFRTTKPPKGGIGLKHELTHYFFKEVTASQKYNVLREEPVAQTIRQEIAILLDRHSADFTPRAVYCPIQAIHHPQGLKIADTDYQLQSQLMHNFFPPNGKTASTTCFLYVVTVGEAADQIIKQYSQNNQPLEAFVLNSLAAALADTLAECLQRYLEAQFKTVLHQKKLHRYSPGYHDWKLADQQIIFAVLNATQNIGVKLNESFLMYPLKSTSGIMGVRQHVAQKND
jgi:hypothetical protein